MLVKCSSSFDEILDIGLGCPTYLVTTVGEVVSAVVFGYLVGAFEARGGFQWLSEWCFER